MKDSGDTVNGQVFLVNKLRSYCKAKGLNISSKRMAVVMQLEKAKDGLAAEDLLLKMRAAQIKISFPYVYQCLNWLESTGFVVKQTGSDKRQLFRINRKLY